MITGSGYFPDVETDPLLVGRAVSSVRAGRSFYVIDLATGKPLGNPNGPCAGGSSAIGCLDLGEVSNGRKNALQADVTAAGDVNSNVVTTAYAGDIDGRYRRFNLQSTGSIGSVLLHDAGQPIYSSSALLFVGTTQRYLFFSTGSDILAASTPGGGGNGSGEAFKLLGVRDNINSGTVTVSRTLSPAVKSTGLPTNGERPTNAPTVAGDIVFFTTTTDSATPSCGDALAKVYAFTYLGTAAYDSDGSGKLENNENPVVATSAGRATAPFIVDQHLYIGTTSLVGAGVTLLGDPEDFNNGAGQVGVRILSWREIR
jgi:Tfp pilus tip-associated adhesin PilY1